MSWLKQFKTAFCKKKKDPRLPPPEYPKWWYMTFTEMRFQEDFDATKILDEFTEIMEKDKWLYYGGIECLAALLLMERKKNASNKMDGK